VLGPATPLVVFFAGSSMLGLVALAMPAMTAVAMHALPAGQAGLASGVLNAARQAGGAMGIALLGSLLGGSRTLTLHVALSVVAVTYVVAGGLAMVATMPRQNSRRRVHSSELCR
jgi:DHA2 family methylenomycin A resistance protein-like MFS transporter